MNDRLFQAIHETQNISHKGRLIETSECGSVAVIRAMVKLHVDDMERTASTIVPISFYEGTNGV